MKKLKQFIKSILPSSVVNFIRYAKQNSRISEAKAKIRNAQPLKEKKSKIAFEINLVEHCNLNCKGCSNFSCLAEPEFVSIDDFKRDMSRMGDIFGHVCERIYLIGGEPLLHPEIIQLMKIARKNFTNGIIYVFTNGLLLSSMNADFWQSCRENDISITISAYPIKLDNEKIWALSHDYGVNVSWAWNENENEHNVFGKSRINLAGNSDSTMNFALCWRANSCITLSKGRLYTCTFAPHVRHFSRYFHKNIEITEADSVNIYDDVTADEILKKMTEPIPACRYCDTISLPEFFTWGPTKKDISEWV